MRCPESTAVLVRVNEDPFTDPERLALAGFLAGYSGLTREADRARLSAFYSSWVADYDLRLFEVRRVAHIEAFARHLETSAGPARRSRVVSAPSPASTATPNKRTSSPSRQRCMSDDPTRLRIPRHRPGPQRGRRHARRRRTRDAQDHALSQLLALNGLRVSEATGANIEALGLERGHRTLTILRKGGKTVIVPLAPAPPARSISRSVNAPKDHLPRRRRSRPGPPRRRPDRWTHRPAKPGSTNESDPTPCATRSSPPRSMPASHPETSKKPRRTPIPAPPCATTEPAFTRPTRHLHRGDLHRRRRPLNGSLRRAHIPGIRCGRVVVQREPTACYSTARTESVGENAGNPT